MNVRTMCLAILFCGDTTGYDIRKASTEGHFSFFVEASFGSIYPALNKLESEGLVTCRHEAQAGKPARKIYSITEEGVNSFITELCQPHKADTYRSEFLLIAQFCQLLGPEATQRAIDLQIKHLEDEIGIIEACARGDLHIEHDYDVACTLKGPNSASDWTQNYGRYCLGAAIDYLKTHGPALVAIAAQAPQQNNAQNNAKNNTQTSVAD